MSKQLKFQRQRVTASNWLKEMDFFSICCIELKYKMVEMLKKNSGAKSLIHLEYFHELLLELERETAVLISSIKNQINILDLCLINSPNDYNPSIENSQTIIANEIGLKRHDLSVLEQRFSQYVSLQHVN
ncbi:MAG: hypothetical protein NVSMB45_06190 [Ginsengibacter sp.]